MTGIRIIKIFLASSSELKDDREQFEIFINRKNKEYIRKSIFLELVIWEDFLDAMSATRLQDEYNNAIGNCDVFVSLFYTKVGQYTEEEFSKALETFRLNQKPLVYTYFKSSPIDISSITIEINSLLKFKNKLNELEHFYKPYKNIDDFKYLFSEQLNKFLPKLADNLLEIPIFDRSQLDQIEKLKQEIKDTERSYKQQKEELKQSLQFQITQLEQQLVQEKSRFTKQQTNLQTAQEKIADKETIIADLQEHIEQLKSDLKTTPKDKVELKSEKGVDYTKLQKLLEQQKWQKADEETANVMLTVASREREGWLTESDIDTFPCEDLRTINQLWLNYSGSKFGFSVQKEIYENLGGTRKYNKKVWNKFGDCVGWRKQENWLDYRELTYTLENAPLGHLPFFPFFQIVNIIYSRAILSRANTCSL